MYIKDDLTVSSQHLEIDDLTKMSSPENSSDDAKDEELIQLHRASMDSIQPPPAAAPDPSRMPPCVFKDAIERDYEYSSRQVHAGIYWMRRVSRLMRNISELEAQFAAQVTKLVDVEMEKADSVLNNPLKSTLKDCMPRTWNAVCQLHLAIKDVAQYHLDLSKKLVSVAKPIKAVAKRHHIQWTKFNAKLDASQKGIAVSREKVTKLKNKTIAMYEAWQKAAVKKNTSRTSDGNLHFSGSFKKLLGEKKEDMPTNLRMSSPFPQHNLKVLDFKILNSANEYMRAVDQFNQTQDKFITDDVSEAHEFFETAERVRIELLQGQLGKVAGIFGEFGLYVGDSMDKLSTSVGMVTSQADLHNFVNIVQKSKNRSQKLAKMEYDLPFDIKDEEPAVSPTSSDQNIFPNLSPSQILNIDREHDPKLKVPRIFTCLTEAIRHLGGWKVEGIFRVSSGKRPLNVLRFQLISGNLDIPSDTDPHVVANLLKEWLRSFSEPLFLNSTYEECIQLAKDEVDHVSGYLSVFSKLPVANREVICRLIEMIHAMGRPEVEKYTRMGLKNLSIVFTPSFLRYKGHDPVLMLKNSVLELQFTTQLIQLYNSSVFRSVTDRPRMSFSTHGLRICEEEEEEVPSDDDSSK